MKEDAVVVVACIVFLAAILFFSFGAWFGGAYVRTQAVKAGAAEWKAGASGEATFHWKE